MILHVESTTSVRHFIEVIWLCILPDEDATINFVRRDFDGNQTQIKGYKDIEITTDTGVSLWRVSK